MYNDIEEFICEFKNKKDQDISKFNNTIKPLVNNYIAHAVLHAYE
jgi:hypothetical protein